MGWRYSLVCRLLAQHSQHPGFDSQDCIKIGILVHACNPRRWQKEGQKFKVILSYVVSSRS